MSVAPRYRTLADELRADIASGRYPVGGQLPPELELCRRYAVSRHTARDALRLLSESGLVERRRGAGTTVTAARPAFVQPIGGIDDLLQYARDARLQVRTTERRALSAAERERLKDAGEGDWLVLDGVRRADGEAIALSIIYIAREFADLADAFPHWQGAIQELLAQQRGLVLHTIEQEIRADLVNAANARRLGVERGSPALRTLRRYYDAAGRMVLASDSLHPAGRFVYAMTYRREG